MILPGKGMPFGNMALTVNHQKFRNHQTQTFPQPLFYKHNLLRLRESGQFNTHFLTLFRDWQSQLSAPFPKETWRHHYTTPLHFPDKSSNNIYLELSSSRPGVSIPSLWDLLQGQVAVFDPPFPIIISMKLMGVTSPDHLLISKAIQGFSSVQFSSVAQSCPTLCDPMNCSMPGLPVHHQFPEFTQTHVHRVSDAIQPSHPLSSPSPPALSPSQHQSLFQWVNSSHEVAKVLEFQL